MTSVVCDGANNVTCYDFTEDPDGDGEYDEGGARIGEDRARRRVRITPRGA